MRKPDKLKEINLCGGIYRSSEFATTQVWREASDDSCPRAFLLSRRLGSELGGEINRKRRAFSRLAFNLDAPAVVLDDTLADRQS